MGLGERGEEVQVHGRAAYAHAPGRVLPPDRATLDGVARAADGPRRRVAARARRRPHRRGGPERHRQVDAAAGDGRGPGARRRARCAARRRRLRVGLLDQRGRPPGRETVAEHLARRTGVAAAERRLDELTERPVARRRRWPASTPRPSRRSSRSAARTSARARAPRSPRSACRPTASTCRCAPSRAARRRALGLAVLLLARLDLLLLDEPTNDLDLPGLDAARADRRRPRGAIVTVSHDRAFLDRCARRIVEIVEPSPRGARVRRAAGATTCASATSRASAATRRHERYVGGARPACPAHAPPAGLVGGGRPQRQEEAARQRPRSGASMQVERSEQQARKVRATERALERLEAVDKPWEGWRLQLRLAPGPRRRRRGRVLEGAVVRRGAFRLGPVDLDVRRGDRVGDDRSERRRQEHPARRPARPPAPRVGGPRASARRSWSGRSSRSASRMLGAPRLLDAFVERDAG